MGTRYPSATSYDYPACTTSSGRCCSLDNKPSTSRTHEHPFRYPSRSCFRSRGYIEELHDHYKKELKKTRDDDSKLAQFYKDQHQSQIREANNVTAHYKKQFEDAMSFVELGEEAEFDAEETAQMRSVRRECETRVNNYEDRMAQLQSDMQCG